MNDKSIIIVFSFLNFIQNILFTFAKFMMILLAIGVTIEKFLMIFLYAHSISFTFVLILSAEGFMLEQFLVF